jgi:hypothetical protein
MKNSTGVLVPMGQAHHQLGLIIPGGLLPPSTSFHQFLNFKRTFLFLKKLPGPDFRGGGSVGLGSFIFCNIFAIFLA